MANTFSGIGKDAIKANNIHAILSCVYRNAPISRRDIARMIHLTPPTVTLLVAELLQCGILRECGEVNEGSRAGRKVVELDFNPHFGYLLGICIEPSGLSFALTSFCGGNIDDAYVIDRMTVENRYKKEELIPELLKLSDAFLGRQKNLEGQFCAIGISMTGHVDPDAGISLNSYGVLPPRTQVTAAFERRYGVPAFLDNNVRSLAQAELSAHPANETINGLFVKQDPGFGCTVLLNGEVYEGATNSSGEIGHTRVVDNGKPCICGKTGCLSTVVSTKSLIASAADVFSPSSTPSLWRECRGNLANMTVPALVRGAQAGDGPLVLLLDEAARLMESVLETSLLLLDGDSVIAFGPIFEDAWFFDRLREHLNASFGGFRSIHLMRSHLSDSDRWKGAVCIALRRYLGVVSAEINEGN